MRPTRKFECGCDWVTWIFGFGADFKYNMCYVAFGPLYIQLNLNEPWNPKS